MQRLLCSTFASAMLLTLTPAHADAQPKIIGGQTASATQFPWQVGLTQGTTNLYDNQFCSGTIIDAQWIVTAAHCIEQPPQNLHVIAGITDLFDERNAQLIRVDQVIIHPQFTSLNSSGALNHDIALLRLSSPIDFVRCGQRCQQIDWLDTRTETTSIAVDTPALINGWGRTVDCTADPTRCETLQATAAGQLTLSPNRLRWASVNISGCLTRPSLHDPRDISANMLCAAAPRFDRDTCQGDSGGGMTVSAADGRGQVLAGITSWGNGCAQLNYPAVYTRVARYDQWIRNRMAGRPSTADLMISEFDNSEFWQRLNTNRSSLSTNSTSGGAFGFLGLGFLAGLGLWRQLRLKAQTKKHAD